MLFSPIDWTFRSGFQIIPHYFYLSVLARFRGENCGNMQNRLKFDYQKLQYQIANISAMKAFIFMTFKILDHKLVIE